jgi:hypothetical protein
VTDLPEGIGGLFHLLGEGVDREVALGHGVELLPSTMARGSLFAWNRASTETYSARASWLGSIDGTVHPATDAGVRLGPGGISRARGLCAIDVP